MISAAMSSWSPERHMVYHGRSGVRMVMLVAERLRRRRELVGALPPQQVRLLLHPSLLVALPNELWRMVCRFFLRSDYPV